MDRTDLAFTGLAQQAQLIRDGEVSSRELVDLYLDRIARIDPELNAFTVVLAEQARAEADSRDGAPDPGQPLRGVPIAVKDVEDVAGVITSFGTAAFEQPAPADGELVRRLRRAGAVILGKTTLPELAITGFTASTRWGVTRNPWDLERTTGGSSGGSAAAVAAGLAGAATASDGAGSIRIPAAFCGVFGLKPQHGRLPLNPADHWYGLSVHGCVTRTVRDTGVFLDATADGLDQSLAEAAARPPGPLRIALSDRPARALLSPIVADEVRAGLAETGELLRSLGHRVFRRDPRFGLAGANFVPRYLRGIRDEIATVPHPERLEPRTRGFGRLGAAYAPRFARRARRLAERDARRINEVFAEADVLVTPTVGELAIEADRYDGRSALSTLLAMSRTYSFTPIWNHTGQPVAAVPAGFSAAGLPRSVSLVGRPGAEATLLSLAAQIEAERPWADRRPPVAR